VVSSWDFPTIQSSSNYSFKTNNSQKFIFTTANYMKRVVMIMTLSFCKPAYVNLYTCNDPLNILNWNEFMKIADNNSDKFITQKVLVVVLRNVIWYIPLPSKLHDVTFQKTIILTLIIKFLEFHVNLVFNWILRIVNTSRLIVSEGCL